MEIRDGRGDGTFVLSNPLFLKFGKKKRSPFVWNKQLFGPRERVPLLHPPAFFPNSQKAGGLAAKIFCFLLAEFFLPLR